MEIVVFPLNQARLIFLEQAGINLDLNMHQTERCIREMGVGFLFAPNHHKAMKYAAGPT